AQVRYSLKLMQSFPSPTLIDVLKAVIAFDMSEAVGAVDTPTLIVTGDRDRIIAGTASRQLARQIRGSKLVEFEGAGHNTIMERHEEVTELVAVFLDDVCPGGMADDGEHAAGAPAAGDTGTPEEATAPVGEPQAAG
ncbi:MAG: alpha/beta fold hydrolase, partial [Nocardioidaceae bacterium]